MREALGEMPGAFFVEDESYLVARCHGGTRFVRTEAKHRCRGNGETKIFPCA